MPILTAKQAARIRKSYKASLKARVRSDDAPRTWSRSDPTPRESAETLRRNLDELQRLRAEMDQLRRAVTPPPPKKRVVKRKPAAKPKPTKTAYDRLMGEDDF
jgi:hypothetical protein